MNILPLIISLLLILGISSMTLLSQRISTEWESISYTGYMRAERNTRNAMARKQYKKLKTSPGESKKSGASDSDHSKYVNRREKHPLPELSKLNLAPLIPDSRSVARSLHYETAARLLSSLYQDQLFSQYKFSSGLEYRLLDHLISAIRSQPKETAFTAFFPDDSLLKEIYYKMLKGTNSQYPPLEEYFSIEPEEKKAIRFHFASKNLLDATFGAKITEEILAIEKQKWEDDPKGRQYSLKQGELEALIAKHSSPSINLPAFQELTSYAKKQTAARTLVSADEISGVQVRKKL
jgi:hypothetical protein